MWVPLQSVRLQCFNVSTQICCPDHPCQFFLLARTAHRPIVHIWICSQIIAGFVPRPSAHLFPISCGLGSNWEGGFVEQEPHICCPAASIFLHPSARPSGPLLNGCKAGTPVAEGLPGDCEILSQVAHILAICASPMPDPSATCASTWSTSTRKSRCALLFQILGPIVSINATMRGSRRLNKLLLLSQYLCY